MQSQVLQNGWIYAGAVGSRVEQRSPPEGDGRRGASGLKCLVTWLAHVEDGIHARAVGREPSGEMGHRFKLGRWARRGAR